MSATKAIAGTILLSVGLGSAAAAGTADAEGGGATPPAAVEEAPQVRPPLPPPDYLPKCLELIRRGRYAEARQRLEPVVALHPGWARASFYLGLTYHEEHRYGRAVELFRHALEADPEYHTPRVYLGWALYYLGDLDQAREALDAFLAVKPGYADAIFALGLIDYDEDDVDAARRHFEQAARLAREAGDASTEAKALARLADVRVRMGRWGEARKELERSIELDPDNYEVYYKLSRVLQRLGDTEGAERARARHQAIKARVRPTPRVMQDERP